MDPTVWINLAMALEPGIFAIVKDIKAMIAKHPALQDPAAQAALVTALGQAAIAVDDAALAKWAADQAAHPPQ